MTCGWSVVFFGYFNKTDFHDIPEILLNVALSTMFDLVCILLYVYSTRGRQLITESNWQNYRVPDISFVFAVKIRLIKNGGI